MNLIMGEIYFKELFIFGFWENYNILIEVIDLGN